jgi:hypothetical protein
MIIKSITKGSGESAEYWEVGNGNYYYCDEIRHHEKTIGMGYYNNLTILVYQIIKDGKIVAEIEANSGLTIRYKDDLKS